MKKMCRIEITRYSRQVMVIQAASDVVETTAIPELPVIDIGSESLEGPRATDESGQQPASLSRDHLTGRQRFRLRDLLKLLPGKQITKLHIVC